MRAAKHLEETKRLAALRRYDILDTPRESDFDEIVGLAAEICAAPISVINLIDAELQWFMAEVGLGVRETPIETSICAHVILENDFVEIHDTLADARMSDNPLCLDDPGLRFYAGAVLKSTDGHPIGTLCVLDYQPRDLNDFQRKALSVLARQVMTQLDLRDTISRHAMLRREIDHRIKNSLQSVNSFVALERITSTEAQAKSALGRVEQQIGTVALLHEQLGVGSDAMINLGPYLSNVAVLLDRSTPASVQVVGRFDGMEGVPSEASILATVITELVTNSVKHSMTAGSGTIRLEGAALAGRLYQVTCEDDGDGSAQASNVSAREGLGLAIIEASVRQLNGTIERNAADGGYRSRIACLLSSPAHRDGR